MYNLFRFRVCFFISSVFLQLYVLKIGRTAGGLRSIFLFVFITALYTEWWFQILILINLYPASSPLKSSHATRSVLVIVIMGIVDACPCFQTRQFTELKFFSGL